MKIKCIKWWAGFITNEIYDIENWYIKWNSISLPFQEALEIPSRFMEIKEITEWHSFNIYLHSDKESIWDTLIKEWFSKEVARENIYLCSEVELEVTYKDWEFTYKLSK